MACAHRIARLPKGAVEDTKRVLNIQLERAVLASLDFALSAEDRSFTSPELRANLDELTQARPPLGTVTPGRGVSVRETVGSPLRCPALSASHPPSASPALSTCSSAMARAAPAVAALHRVEQRRVLAAAALLLLGEELEVVARHDP